MLTFKIQKIYELLFMLLFPNNKPFIGNITEVC